MNDQRLTINKKYQSVIGLEVHVELYTKSKMFCRCSADYFGKEPNTHVCPVCLGLPGALPVPNTQAIEWCIMIGLALNCQIPLFSKFDRKNYFYPDLAKGYQISQYDKPFCTNGFIYVSSTSEESELTSEVIGERGRKKIGITRAHMEEDTGKLIHATVDGERISLIDFNRSGVPLVEIVTEPDFESAVEVVEYLKKLQQIVRYLGVSSADMEKGDMRLEPNISLRPVRHPGVATTMIGSKKRDSIVEFTLNKKEILRSAQDDRGEGLQNDKILPPYKVEVKNINSFKFVEKAINYELARQAEILDRGETPAQETRGWNEQKNATVSQRSKEEAHDYRYFPEPDIPPIRWTEAQIKKLRASLPEMPDEKFSRFKEQYQIPLYEIEILTRNRKIADFYEEAVKIGIPWGVTSRQVSVVMINKKPDIDQILPAAFIKSIVVSSTRVMVADEKELKKIIEQIISQNQKAVDDYKKGYENALMFLVGQVMRKLGTKLEANRVKSLLEEKLK